MNDMADFLTDSMAEQTAVDMVMTPGVRRLLNEVAEWLSHPRSYNDEPVKATWPAAILRIFARRMHGCTALNAAVEDAQKQMWIAPYIDTVEMHRQLEFALELSVAAEHAAEEDAVAAAWLVGTFEPVTRATFAARINELKAGA